MELEGLGSSNELSGVADLAPVGPVACAMPDLSDIGMPVMLDYILNALFRGTGSSDPKASAYLIGFIRVVDKAMFEYCAARATLTEYCRSRNRVSLYLRTIAHLETCINSVKRAHSFLSRLGNSLRQPGLDPENREEAERDKETIRSIRNAIEHMDEWIQKDKVADGELITLAVSDQGDRAMIAGFSIDFADLANGLRGLRALALILSGYRSIDEDTEAIESPSSYNYNGACAANERSPRREMPESS